MALEPFGDQTILALLPSAEDRQSLDQIFTDSKWTLRFACNLLETETALDSFLGPVVISDSRLSDGQSWKDVLYELQRIKNPPLLIVAAQEADAQLWAEVLNLGVFDVLVKPFDAKEVRHVLTTACDVHGWAKSNTN